MGVILRKNMRQITVLSLVCLFGFARSWVMYDNSIHSKLEFIEKYGTNAFNKCRSTRRFIDSGKCAVRFCEWKNGKMNMGGVQQWFPPAYLGKWCRIVVNQNRSTSKLYERGISDSDIIDVNSSLSQIV